MKVRVMMEANGNVKWCEGLWNIEERSLIDEAVRLKFSYEKPKNKQYVINVPKLTDSTGNKIIKSIRR